MEQGEHSSFSGGNAKLYIHVEINKAVYQKNGNNSTPRSSYIVPGHIPKNLPSHKDICTTMFIETLFVFVFVCFFFQDRVSLCSPCCPGTHSVDQAGLELRNLPASASQVWALKTFQAETLFVNNQKLQTPRCPSSEEWTQKI